MKSINCPKYLTYSELLQRHPGQAFVLCPMQKHYTQFFARLSHLSSPGPSDLQISLPHIIRPETTERAAIVESGRSPCPPLKPFTRPYFHEDPQPKAKEITTFPSKAGQEKRRRRTAPQAPVRGEAPKMAEEDFQRRICRQRRGGRRRRVRTKIGLKFEG